MIAACTSAFGSVPQEDPLIGTKAVLESLNGHEPLKDTEIIAEFVEYEHGPRVIGSTGCNQYVLRYQQDGNHLAISQEDDPTKQGVVTQLLCVEPEGAMEQEYLNTLKEVASFQTIADRLEMQNQAGQTILVFKKME
jgi:heat shock protein HslJ